MTRNNDLPNNFFYEQKQVAVNSADDPGEKCAPCCNAGRPTDCIMFPQRSLYVEDLQRDICITREYCLEVYAYYGNPPDLSGIEVPSSLIEQYTNKY